MSDAELISTFLEEATENLQVMEEGLLELEKTGYSYELIDQIFRAMHTVKGGSGLVGLNKISDLAHHLENILDRIRDSGCGLTMEVFNILFTGIDFIKKMLETDNFEDEELLVQMDVFINTLETYENKQAENTSPIGANDKAFHKAKQSEKKTYYRIELKFRRDIFETGTDPLMLLLELQEMGNLLEVYANTTSLPKLAELDPYQLYIYWTVFFETEKPLEEIETIFIFVRDENEIKIEDISSELEIWFSGDKKTGELLLDRGLVSKKDIEAVLSKQKRLGELLVDEGVILKDQVEHVLTKQQQFREQEQASTIRVDTHKLEGILNSIAELLIAQSRVKELVFNLFKGERTMNVELYNSFQEVDKIIRFLQEEVLNASMIPIGGTFIRYQRMVRDLAREKGKEINIVLSGKETELDKKVIEKIADPLKHLLRNSIDHGIELPQERIAKGKTPEGTIWLNAYHQEGNIIIEIKDDGRGINEEAVRAKALERGLISKDDELSPQEIRQLLFRPGFSTAKEITDISGRGVGLDVVMTNIKNLRGSIELLSEKDKGTSFIIRLPLTLAIIDGMMVRVGGERFVIPLTSISEFVKIQTKDILKAEDKAVIVHLRKEYIPYIGLYEIFNIEPKYTAPTEGIIVVLKENQKSLALLVDEIIGQEQVVIKSLRENMGQVEGIAGATILGDGKVAVILDVSSLFRLAKNRTGRS